jgi:photosystem II stability/assembly factor-like uncharacterized protein
MKKILFSMLAIITFQATLKAQLSWQALLGAPISWRCDDMYFLNPDKGWAVNPYYDYLFPNQYGRVFTTNDGGQTWSLLFDSSVTFIRSVGFADTLNGWFGNLGDPSLTSDTNYLYHTTDGGTTWSPVINVNGDVPKGICGISVVTDSVIYAYGRYFGPAVILKTIDKGQSWSSQNLDPMASGLVDGYFFTPDTGFITGTYGSPPRALILSTFDGGSTWQVRHQSLRDQEIVWKIVFPSRNIGYASIESDTDGGLTWQEKIFKTNGFYELQGIGFINDTIGWIGGDPLQPQTYKTEDGGNTWIADNTFGVQVPPYDTYPGYEMNRFRRFGDTLMYASGNTIYKLQTATGILSIDSNTGSISIYPNPTNGKFILEMEKMINDGVIEIFNLFGENIYRSVIKNEKPEIDISNQSSGIYFIRIKTNDSIFYQKIVKQ